MVEVILSAEFPILREGIEVLFKDSPGVKLVDYVKSNLELISKYDTKFKNFVFLSELNNGINNFDSIKRILQCLKNIKLLVLTEFYCDNLMVSLIREGVKGYILQNTGKEEMLVALKKIKKGETYIDSKIAIKVIEKYMANKPYIITKENLTKLSDSEKKILKLIASGYTTREIAEKLFRSKRTIETHRMNLIKKTNSKNTAALITYAIENGLINLSVIATP